MYTTDFTVYGANTNDGIHMYDSLQRDILSLRNTNIVLGGDWNAVWDRSPVDSNIDIINMVNVPSARRTDRIHALCETLKLTDPYRIIYPHNSENGVTRRIARGYLLYLLTGQARGARESPPPPPNTLTPLGQFEAAAADLEDSL